MYSGEKKRKLKNKRLLLGGGHTHWTALREGYVSLITEVWPVQYSIILHVVDEVLISSVSVSH